MTHRALAVHLPGGLVVDGALHKQAVFRPLTGYLEERLATLAEERTNPPRAVSLLLDGAFALADGTPWSPGRAAELSAGDRKYLLVCLGIHLCGDDLWLRPTCQGCGALFDVKVARSSLPVKPAGRDYPFVELPLRGERVMARVPSGADQERVAEMEEEAAVCELVRRCIVSVSGRPAPEDFFARLTGEDIATLEKALEEASPDVGMHVATSCPECGQGRILPLNLYGTDGAQTQGLYEEVHTLAFHYHWTEHEILSLPRDRRKRYLRLIDRACGISS